jgi:hypothetical protein
MKHGRGIYIWPSGSSYNGQWFEGAKNGRGVMVDPQGNITHDGMWKHDKPVLEFRVSHLDTCCVSVFGDILLLLRVFFGWGGCFIVGKFCCSTTVHFLLVFFLIFQICKEIIVSGQNILTTACHHVFHQGCCEDWIRTKGSCPICRSAAAPSTC